MEVTNEMNRSQLKRSVQDLTVNLGNMSYLRENNCQLMRELQLLKSKEENSKMLLKENTELKKELRTRRDVLQVLKETKYAFLKREERLKKTIKEKDALYKQLKLECNPLKKTIKHLEAALSKQEKELSEKIHNVELEVEKSQKKVGKLLEKNDSLQSTNSALQEDKNKLQKQMYKLEQDLNTLQFENNSLDKKCGETYARELHQKQIALTLDLQCCDLKKQLEWSKRKREVKHPCESFNEHQESTGNKRTTSERGLQSKLVSKTLELEKKDMLVEARDTQIEQLKKDMARLMPPEKVELITKYKQKIRERGETIKALKAEVEMYKCKHEECKSERDTLVQRLAAIKKLYLKAKVQLSDLFALTKVNGILLSQSSNALQKQCRENQFDSSRTTLKPAGVRFPHISN